MSSNVSICNRALDKIGEPPITALSDDTKAGRACNRLFGDCRDEVLAAHPWNFAIKRASLAVAGTTVDQAGLSRYTLPADCLRVLDVDTTYDWYVEAGAVVIDGTGALDVRYVAAITDAGSFSKPFTTALQGYLAVELCEAITQSNTKRQTLADEYERVILPRCKRLDAREGVAKKVPDSSWVTERVS